MKVSGLKNRPVVSMADGTRVGEVQDALIECAGLRVSALLIDTPSGQFAIRFGSIKRIGADAVTLDQAANALEPQDNLKMETQREFAQLRGLQVVNAEGTVLGDLRDVDLDLESGQVAEIEVHRGGLFGVGGASLNIPGAQLRSLGPDFVTTTLATPEPAPATPPSDPVSQD